MFQVEFRNSKPQPLFVQVNPWACVYKVNQGEQLELQADSPVMSSVDFDGNLRIVTLHHCQQFFVVRAGRRLPCDEYPTNMEPDELQGFIDVRKRRSHTTSRQWSKEMASGDTNPPDG